MKHVTVWVLGLMGVAASAGCGAGSHQEQTIRVSTDSARILNDIGDALEEASAEVRIHCTERRILGVDPHCRIRIDESEGTPLSAELIHDPFTQEPLAYRIADGSDALRRSLYEALGAHTDTRDFQYNKSAEVVNARVLKLEDGKIKLRCISSKNTPVLYSCWVILQAEILQ